MLKSVQSMMEFATWISCSSQLLRAASVVKVGLPMRSERRPTIPSATLILMSHSTQFSFPCNLGTLENTLAIFSHREAIARERRSGEGRWWGRQKEVETVMGTGWDDWTVVV